MAAYVDTVSSWWPPTSIAAGLGVPGYATANNYNLFILAFWLYNGGPVDCAVLWSNPVLYFGTDSGFGATTAAIQQSLLKLYHQAGKKLIVSAFGSTEMPVTAGYDAATVCNALANFVLANQLDGVDLDFEDSAAFSSGAAVPWIITCVKTLRAKLPVGQYIVTAAPQAPYFYNATNVYPNGGWMGIHQAVGNMMDLYLIQFYNQGTSEY